MHRAANETFDESADLTTLARLPITVVCAGVKSILDVGATLERLETLGVAVIGYGSRRFPGFYLADSGFDLDWSVDRPESRGRGDGGPARPGRARGRDRGGQPAAGRRTARPRSCTTACSTAGLAGLAREGITGKAVTPYLLAHFHRETAGASLDVNVRIILRNAALAARIAAAYAAMTSPTATVP